MAVQQNKADIKVQRLNLCGAGGEGMRGNVEGRGRREEEEGESEEVTGDSEAPVKVRINLAF